LAITTTDKCLSWIA